jgi:hypothetical protein
MAKSERLELRASVLAGRIAPPRPLFQLSARAPLLDFSYFKGEQDSATPIEPANNFRLGGESVSSRRERPRVPAAAGPVVFIGFEEWSGAARRSDGHNQQRLWQAERCQPRRGFSPHTFRKEDIMSVKLVWAAVALICLSGARLCADEVIDWNNVLLDTVRTNSMSPLPQTRISAAMNTAMYDAINSITRTHRPYHVDMTAAPGTSREAAAAQAAHRVLSGLFPANQAKYDEALANSLSSVPDGPGKTAGVALGNTVGAAILALRANDGAGVVAPYTPGTDPGDWRPTPPANAPAAAPQWANVTPWVMTSPSQFRNPDGPPALDSAEYTAAFNQVKEIGAATSATRTPDQSNIAQFWAGQAGTSTPVGHWNRIAQTVAASQGTTLEENARLFALLGIAQADAAIAAWDNKYHYNYWRPVTAIREAATDDNPDTAADSNWNSFIATPNFPSYTAGHGTVSGASGAVLADFFVTDNITFTSSTEGFAVPDRTFTSFSQAATEGANSRLYGGIHWDFDNQHGLAGGQAVGHYVYATQLRPIPEPGSFVLLVLGMIASLAGRRPGRVS